jgi:DNA-binding transcriptional LysR family regulator
MRWQEVKGLDLIRRERGSDIRDATDLWLKERNIALKAKVELNNTEAIKAVLRAGMGFSLLPQSTIEEDIREGHLRIIRVPHLNLTQNYYICHYRDKAFSGPEKAFLKYLFEAVESGTHAEL